MAIVAAEANRPREQGRTLGRRASESEEQGRELLPGRAMGQIATRHIISLGAVNTALAEWHALAKGSPAVTAVAHERECSKGLGLGFRDEG